MFDWDRDFDTTVQHRLIDHAEVLSASPTPGQPRQHLRWGIGMAVALLLAGSATLAGLVSVGPVRAGAVSIASVWPSVLMGADPVTMPADLLTYERPQFDSFRQGIARFSDADLLGFAEATQRGLGPLSDPMTAYGLDALALTDQELGIRGLSRPAGSEQIESLRAAAWAARGT